MSQQSINFFGRVEKVVNRAAPASADFAESTRSESKTDSITVKLTARQKQLIQDVCFEAGGIGASTFANQAIECFLDIHPYKEKIHRHRAFLVDLLERLS